MTDEQKYRMTKQRAIILDYLRKTGDHPTADQIYDEVKGRMPRISLGTVYRNLEFLCSQGLVCTVDTGCSQRRYECVGELHYHVRCIDCGCVEDLYFELETSIEDLISKDCDFEITGHRLEFIGYCPKCGKHQDGKSK